MEKLIEKGIDVAFPVTSNPVGVINQSVENEMRAALCTTCPFFSGDCDFISGEGDAKPCGGFIVLAGLVDKGTMRIDDIRNIE